jgi:hypothetical protein
MIMPEDVTLIDPDRVTLIGDGPDPVVLDPRVVIVSAVIGAGLVIAWYKCRRWMKNAREQNQVVTGGQSIAATRDMADSGDYPQQSNLSPQKSAFSMRADVPHGSSGQGDGNPSWDGSLDYPLPSDTNADIQGLSREQFSVTAYW